MNKVHYNETNNNVEVKNVKYYTEFDENIGKERYFLSITYTYETLDGVYELTVPKIELPVSNVIDIEAVDINNSFDVPLCYRGSIPNWKHYIRLGDTKLPIREGTQSKRVKPCCYYVKELKKKTRKMTVSEIEKQLGYRVEIVSDK